MKKTIGGLVLSAALLIGVALPAAATYREGNVSCAGGYDAATLSTSSTYTTHTHWMEGQFTTVKPNAVGLGVRYYSQPNYGSWEMTATNMAAGYAYCIS